MIHAALARITFVTLTEDMVKALASTAPHDLPFVSSPVESAGIEVIRLESALPSGLHAAVLKSVAQGPAPDSGGQRQRAACEAHFGAVWAENDGGWRRGG